MTEKTYYVCDICKRMHDTKEECEKCEASHPSVKGVKGSKYLFDDPYPDRVNIEFTDGTIAVYDFHKILQGENEEAQG